MSQKFSKKALGSLLALAALQLSATAHAQTTGSVGIASDYIYRGVSQTNRKPEIFGNIEYAHSSGFYVGAAGTNVSWLSDLSTSNAPISSSVEIDLSAGFRGKMGKSATYDVGVLSYVYPGSYPKGFTKADTTEIYAGAAVPMGERLALSGKYSHSVTNLFGFANSRNSSYGEMALDWTVAEGWTLGSHVGRQRIAHNRAFNYTDWRVGVTRSTSNGYAFSLAWISTNANKALYTNPFGKRIADDTVVLSAVKKF